MYSVNQVNQFYVVTKIAEADIQASDPVGTLSAPMTSPDESYMYFKYKGAGGIISTDRIKKCKVLWGSYATAASMDSAYKTWTLALSGNPIVGQDYIIHFNFRSYFGMSDEDQYNKSASARAFSATAKELYIRLAVSIAKNFSREVDLPFKVQLGYSTSSVTDVTPLSKYETLVADGNSYNKIILTEVAQPWELGRMKLTRPDFEIIPSYITDNGLDRTDWLTITTGESASVITNGKETADLEWFFHGERGDQYRGKDWPLSISTPDKLLVNPDAKYDYGIVHFYDDIDNEGPQKSERDITFVTAAGDSAPDLEDLVKTIVEFSGLDSYSVDGTATPVAAAESDDDSDDNH